MASSTVFGGRSGAPAAIKSGNALMTKEKLLDAANITDVEARDGVANLIANATSADRARLCSMVTGYQQPPVYKLVAARLLGATTGNGVAAMFGALRAAGVKTLAPRAGFAVDMGPEGERHVHDILAYGSIVQLRAVAEWAQDISRRQSNERAKLAAFGVFVRVSNIANALEDVFRGKAITCVGYSPTVFGGL